MSKLNLKRPQPSDRNGIVELTAKTFTSKPYWDWKNYCQNGYLDDSHYDWNASTIGVIENEIVTHWGIWGYKMRLDSSVLQIAGVGAVATGGKMRKMGLMGQTIVSGIQASKEAGYDMSILYGIENFYHKYGYVKAWPYQTYVLSYRDLPSGIIPTLHSFSLDDRKEIVELYNKENKALSGTAIRPTYHKLGRRHEAHLWYEQEKISGYVVVDVVADKLIYLESVGEAELILNILSHLCNIHKTRVVEFTELHYESNLASYLRKLNCRLEITHFRSGGAMVRMLSLQSTLEKMLNEFSIRIQNSKFHDWKGNFSITTNEEKVVLSIEKGQVKINPSNHENNCNISVKEEIAQLILGTDVPESIINFQELDNTTRELVKLLFPHRHLSLGRCDWF